MYSITNLSDWSPKNPPHPANIKRMGRGKFMETPTNANMYPENPETNVDAINVHKLNGIPLV